MTRRAALLSLVLAALVAALGACPPTASGRCNSDLDCPNLQRCDLGICTPVGDEADSGPTPDDAGPPMDGGDLDGDDGGEPEADGGGADAGSGDAGRADPDAGDPRRDAGGGEPVDGGGPPPGDAGPGPTDGGVVDSDAGTVGPTCAGDAPPQAPCSQEHAGLVACWDFEGAASGADDLIVPDAIGGHEASGTGRLSPSLHGSGYDPDATGWLSLPVPSVIAEAGPMSVDAWVYVRTMPSGLGASTRGVVYDSNAQFGIMLHPAGMACAASTLNDSTFRVITNGFPTGRWVHVTCTLAPDGQGLIAYVDGVEAARAAHTAELMAPNGPIFLGANSPTGTEQLDGVIDDVRVFRARRSAADACWAARP